MGFELLAYNLSSDTASGTNTDFVAATDPDFSQRNSHYIFTEPYKLLSVFAVGASLSRGRFQVPTWNAIGEFTIFGVGTSLEPNSNMQFDQWLWCPPPIPMMEEFQVQMSNTGAGGAIENAAVLIGTTDWNQNLPTGRMCIQIRASFTVTHTLNGWSGPQSITLSQSLRGGVYAVVGAQLQADDAVWFRLIFPRYRLYHGRKLRPGFLVQNAVGQPIGLPLDNWPFTFGEWGRFHTFELPQCETFGTAADSTTCQLFLWLVYLGEDVSQLGQGLGGGM
jgi:hypothetical protein